MIIRSYKTPQLLLLLECCAMRRYDELLLPHYFGVMWAFAKLPEWDQQRKLLVLWRLSYNKKNGSYKELQRVGAIMKELTMWVGSWKLNGETENNKHLPWIIKMRMNAVIGEVYISGSTRSNTAKLRRRFRSIKMKFLSPMLPTRSMRCRRRNFKFLILSSAVGKISQILLSFSVI